MRRILLVTLLLYLGADYCDPAIPGVFFFDTDSFFVDAAVQQRSAPVHGSFLHTPPVLWDDPRGRSEVYDAAPPKRAAVVRGSPDPRPTELNGYLPVKTPAEGSQDACLQ
jgi:hypothetical protein